MKIDKLDSLLDLIIPEKKGGGGKSGGVGFQKIFEEIQANQAGEKQRLPEGGTVSRAAEIPDDPLNIYSLSPLADSRNPLQSHTRSLQAADRVLQGLEEYQKGLGDSEVSLKALYPALQALSAEVRGMSREAEKLPPNDPLRRILDEIGVLAAVETEKFNRGDYVS